MSRRRWWVGERLGIWSLLYRAPQPDHIVASARCQPLAVRRERDAIDLVCVALESLQRGRRESHGVDGICVKVFREHISPDLLIAIVGSLTDRTEKRD